MHYILKNVSFKIKILVKVLDYMHECPLMYNFFYGYASEHKIHLQQFPLRSK